MGLMTAWSRYQKLDERQKDFMRRKVLRASLTLEEWIRFLHPVSVVDRDADEVRKILLGVGIVFLPLGLLGAIILSSGWPLLGMAVGIGLIVLSSRMGGLDVPPNLAEFLLPWLALLREDVVPGSAVHLAIDLRGSICPPKKQVARSGDRNPGGWNTDVFLDSWFSGEASFVDHAVVKWSVSDLVRRRIRTRRNARGKTKTKTKHKVLRTWDVQVRVRGKDYRTATNEVEGTGEVRTDIHTDGRKSVVRARTRRIVPHPDHPPRLVEMVDAVAAAYRHLSPAGSRGTP